MKAKICEIVSDNNFGKKNITHMKFVLMPESMEDTALIELVESQGVKISLKEIKDV